MIELRNLEEVVVWLPGDQDSKYLNRWIKFEHDFWLNFRILRENFRNWVGKCLIEIENMVETNG